MRNPFRYFNRSNRSDPPDGDDVIRYPLSLRQVEDLLFERGIDICNEAVRFCWNPFGSMLAVKISVRRIQRNSNKHFLRWV